MRHRARKMALQALYQWHFSHTALTEIEAQFHTFNNMSNVDTEFFHELLHAIPSRIPELDAAFTPFLDRPLKEISPVELAVLRMGTYELQSRLDIPYRVVIDEALKLARSFGATDGHKYINAILDKLAHQCRQPEIAG